MRFAAFFCSLALVGASISDTDESCAQPDETAAPQAASLLQTRRATESSGSVVATKTSTKLLKGFNGLDGLLAPLSEAGYARVAAHHSPEMMEQFMRRMLVDMNVPLNTHVLRKYSDVVGSPTSFEDLRSAISEASGVSDHSQSQASSGTTPLTRPGLTGLSSAGLSNVVQYPGPGIPGPKPAGDMQQPGHMQKPEPQPNVAMPSPAASVPPSLNVASLVHYGGKVRGTSANGDTGLGSNSVLDEAGYQTVQQMRNNHEMEVFMRRTIADLDLVIVNEEGLNAMVPWLSGESGSSSFGNFKGKILNMLGKPDAWVADPQQPEPLAVTEVATPKMALTEVGNSVALSEEGYMAAANLRSNTEMVSFINRVVDDMGLKVKNRGGVEGLAPFYSGDKQVGSLASLESEIFKASETPGSWVAREVSPAA